MSLFDEEFKPVDENDKFVDIRIEDCDVHIFDDIDSLARQNSVTITFAFNKKDKTISDFSNVLSNEILAIVHTKFKSLQVKSIDIDEPNYKKKYEELVRKIKKIIED